RLPPRDARQNWCVRLGRQSAGQACARCARPGQHARASGHAGRRRETVAGSARVEKAGRTPGRCAPCPDCQPVPQRSRLFPRSSARLPLGRLVRCTNPVSIPDRSVRIRRTGSQPWPCGYFRPSRALASAQRSQTQHENEPSARGEAIEIRLFGADARNRTADLLITNQLLYQLSYPGRRAFKLLYLGPKINPPVLVS
ncbi:MAG: hypothetical protein RLZ35_82, partial [Pseudomonadota bacterium]